MHAHQKFHDDCAMHREMIQGIEVTTRQLLTSPVFNGEERYPGQHGEMKANITLAVRHLEDARMRVGKVMQHADNGVSCFDNAPVETFGRTSPPVHGATPPATNGADRHVPPSCDECPARSAGDGCTAEYNGVSCHAHLWRHL
jgi:hypothetical protein